MSTTNAKAQCFSCKKTTRTFNCDGCSQNFCFDCLTKHLQELRKHLNVIENDHDQFRQKINDQKKDAKKRPLIQQVDQWEEDSINKIKQTAQHCRQRLMNFRNKFIFNIENNLNNVTKQIKQLSQENQFNEIDLEELKEKLKILKEELDKPLNISIQQQSSTFINRIFVVSTFDKDTKWKQHGIVVAGGNGSGNKLNQLFGPQCMFIDNDQTIYIADCGNHRIVEWKYNSTNGEIVAGGNDKGSQMNQFDRPGDLIIDKETNSWIISDLENRRVMRWPRQNDTTGQIIIKDIDCDGITMDKNGFLYVADSKKNEVRRWKIGEKTGTIVAGGNGQGDGLNQLNYPTCILVDDDFTLYVSDCFNHRVMKWAKDAKEGIIVAGGQGQGDSLAQLHCPQGLVVDQLGQIYVTDWGNHRVMRWSPDAQEGIIIVGGNEQGEQTNQLNCPVGLSFDVEGNIYVADCENHRIQKFEID